MILIAMELSQTQKEQLNKIFSENKVCLAYLFGSLARGKTGRLSDVDIAVYFDDEIPNQERFSLKLDLIDELQKVFQKNVDLVVLQDAPPLLINKILKEGIKVYSKNEEKRAFFETCSFMEFLDWKWHLDKYTKATFESI